jgi:hypothetical protein
MKGKCSATRNSDNSEAFKGGELSMVTEKTFMVANCLGQKSFLKSAPI